MSIFATPASASSFDLNDHLGNLVVVIPQKVDTINTKFGPSEAVLCDIHVLDGAPGDHEDVLLFGKVLLGQLKTRIGEMVLGRIGQGIAKAGNNPPWVIEAATEQDAKTGEDWYHKRQAGTFAKPAATAPAQSVPETTTVAATPPAPAPVATTTEDDALPKKVKQLIKLGKDDAFIAGQLDLDADVVAMIRTEM